MRARLCECSLVCVCAGRGVELYAVVESVDFV